MQVKEQGTKIYEMYLYYADIAPQSKGRFPNSISAALFFDWQKKKKNIWADFLLVGFIFTLYRWHWTLALEDADSLAWGDRLAVKVPSAKACIRGRRGFFKRERECLSNASKVAIKMLYNKKQLDRCIKAAYIEVSKLSPFEPEYQSATGIPVEGADYFAADWFRIDI